MVACGIFDLHCSAQNLQLWHVGSSSLTRDGTWPSALGGLLALVPPGESFFCILKLTVLFLNTVFVRLEVDAVSQGEAMS